MKLSVILATIVMMSSIFSSGVLAADPDLETVRAILKQYYVTELSDAQLQGDSVAEIIEKLDDPYTMIFTAKDFTDFTNALEGEFPGIGIEMIEKDGYIEIVSVMAGFPAQKAGLQAQDMIMAVDGIDLAQMPIDQVSRLIRGEPGTKVNLTIKRGDQIIQFTVTREKIDVPVVSSEMLTDHVLYISISSFASDTADLVQQELAQHPDTAGIILDLRDNGGGYVQAAVEVGQEFLDKGPMVWVQNRNGTEAINLEGSAAYKQPMVLLVNHGSASASEIIAGAFQDEQRAVLVGATTYGKFCMQDMVSLNDGYVLKFTTYYFLTPTQRLLNKIGVSPDIAADDENALAVAERSVSDQQLMKDNYRYLLTFDLDDMSAYVNAKKQFDGQSIVKNNHLYLNLRDVASETGLSVWWDAGANAVMVQKGAQPIELSIDNSQAFVADGKTYLSMRELAQLIGGNVAYNSSSNVAWLQWN